MPIIADLPGIGLQRGRASQPPTPATCSIAIMPWADIAAAVRGARSVRRQTQAQFAHEVGLSIRTVGALEAGDPHTYDETTVARVESALGWTAGSFDRVVNGMRPIEVGDPYLARVVDAWHRLPVDVRRILAELVGVCLAIDDERRARPRGSDTDGG